MTLIHTEKADVEKCVVGLSVANIEKSSIESDCRMDGFPQFPRVHRNPTGRKWIGHHQYYIFF